MIPYIKDTDVILPRQPRDDHQGSDLTDAYFKTEISRRLLSNLDPVQADQSGRSCYFDEKAAELIKIKPALGIRDVRLKRRTGELRPLRQQPVP